MYIGYVRIGDSESPYAMLCNYNTSLINGSIIMTPSHNQFISIEVDYKVYILFPTINYELFVIHLK